MWDDTKYARRPSIYSNDRNPLGGLSFDKSPGRLYPEPTVAVTSCCVSSHELLPYLTLGVELIPSSELGEGRGE
jgi:hypothetical protein